MFSLCKAWLEVSVVPRGGRVRMMTGEMVVVVTQLVKQHIEGSHVRGQVRCTVLYMANICVYLLIHGVSQCKSCSLHFKPDFLDILCNSFKARLKIWVDFKTTDQVSLAFLADATQFHNPVFFASN